MRVLADFPRCLIYSPSCLLSPSCSLADLLRIVADPFSTFIDPVGNVMGLLGVLVNVLLYSRLSEVSDCSCERVGPSHLVVCDCVSQLLDEAVQGIRIINILQELHEPMLFRQRSEPCDDPSQLPADDKGCLETRECLCSWAVQTLQGSVFVPSLRCHCHQLGTQVPQQATVFFLRYL